MKAKSVFSVPSGVGTHLEYHIVCSKRDVRLGAVIKMALQHVEVVFAVRDQSLVIRREVLNGPWFADDGLSIRMPACYSL